ncbi:MAG: HPF/RaiA family ribosome-associated protein [Burkholderiales bacterium]|nr:ribosome-associated translation inhibitor RaiA [Burkholderiales bacterium]MCJ7838799.1 HPF/RaiA family ribosome-associated protein [Burkholderiales bacterium]
MHSPVEIVLRGIPTSSALESYIGEEARKLDAICDRIRSCQVFAEALRSEKRQGGQVSVRLIITLPGTEVVVNREHGDDVYAALRVAFTAAGLQLKDHMRRGNKGNHSRNGESDPRA